MVETKKADCSKCMNTACKNREHFEYEVFVATYGCDDFIRETGTQQGGNARTYLQNVLDRWPEFCKGHPNFALAIKEILTENEAVKTENKRLKERIENNNAE